MKKKILALAMVAISLSIVAYGSLAYFTASGTAHNVITSGAVAIEVVEWTLDGDEPIPYPDEPIKVMPATTVSKIVTVENKDAEAFVRAQFAVIVKNAEGEVMELEEATLDSLIQIEPNSAYWLTNEANDGWYYYKETLRTDAVTEALFSKVVFAGKDMGNEYQNCTVEIDVKAQAVQADNNGGDVLKAAGWPEE